VRRGLSRVGVVTVAILAGALALSSCGGGSEKSKNAKVPGRTLATRTIKASEVKVTIAPLRIDATGAEFEVKLDTHSGDLDVDVAKSARLTVGGTEWSGATWKGAGPGGHHREGRLTFPAAGPVSGRAGLTINGLGKPNTVEWSL